MIESATFGHKYTSYLKIKLDADLDKAIQILNALADFDKDDKEDKVLFY